MAKPLYTDRVSESYLKEIAHLEPLSREEEYELSRRIRMGDLAARDRLVKHNLRFVVSVAKPYQHLGIPLSDLINQGNLGLLTAAERFDESMGFKFISYAVNWIRQSILMYIAEQGRPVRLPINRVDDLIKISKFKREFQQQYGGIDPSLEEIAEYMNRSPAKIAELLNQGRHALSIDACFDDQDGEPGKNSLHHILASNAATPEEYTELQGRDDAINDMLHTLEKREAEVVSMYFGIGRKQEMTLQQIGDRYGLTRERARQIKETALHKLRHHSRARKLRPYVEPA